MRWLLASLLFAGASSSSPSSPIYRHLGYFESPYCAFLNIGRYEGQKAFFATSFGGSVPGAIDFVPEFAGKLNNLPSIKPEKVVNNIVWPNEVTDIPEDIFGPNHILSCGGFLVPTFRTGEVLVTDVKQKITYKVSTDETGYFYHLGEFYDVDGDGLKDIVTAKTNYPFVGPGDGKLVWFKNPGTMTFPWKETLLFRGPDVFFRIYDLNNDGREEIIASIFVNKKLSVFYNQGNFSTTADWKERVVDNALGSPFDVRLADLNNDGKVELLVTNHQNQIDESAVFAYEVPHSDLANGKYTRHVIASGFETTQPGDGQASPGSAQAFFPILSQTNQKPLVMVSGDGSQKAHLLRPRSEDPADWGYSMETIIFVNNTVGGIAVDDVDEDGYMDFFVPNYDDGHVHVFTFSPY